MAIDVYQMVTDRILAELDKGRIPWQLPWSSIGGAISHTTGKRYSLLNQLLLGCRAGEWLTFKQCQEEGGHVRKGEKGSPIVFFKFLDVEDEVTHETEQIPLLKYYTVFHITQCEGIKPRFTVPAAANEHQPDEAAERISSDYISRTGIRLHIEASDQAFYSPSDDAITVPQMSQYSRKEEFYSTLFHEMTHSTGHVSRLNRLSDISNFGSASYSKEELVAELGAAYLVNHCGLETDSSFRNSVGYLQSWLRELKNDKRLIVTAAGKAEKAVQLILGDAADEEP